MLIFGWSLVYLLFSMLVYVVICNIPNLGKRLEKAFSERRSYDVLEIGLFLLFWVFLALGTIIWPRTNN